MRIICLIENTSVNDKLYYEEGLSLFVEYGGKNYLIDTGLTGRAVDNARRMRLPIDDISAVFLTHNHIAHTGGMEQVMRLNPKAEIYIRAGAKEDVFRKNGLFKSPVGQGKGFFKKYANNLILFNNFSEVCEGFYLASCEDFEEKAINPDRSYYTISEEDKKPQPFDFSDESFAVIFPKKRKAEGLILIGGCFHCGAENMLETVSRRWYGIPILAVIGGFHFSSTNPKALNCSADYVTAQSRALKLSGAEKIYACHCTGFRGFDLMDEMLGDRIMYLGGGEALEF
ncbi:MAG: MBL fold metallo-hydrolase [Oscillospiraceae bacterium]|nr:MBL fold metallo-hydrolase [Oscillospiraceae bacterium]